MKSENVRFSELPFPPRVSMRTPEGQNISGYTITDLAKMLGRKPLTLRLWEKAGLLPSPRYRARNWRIYTPDEVGVILRAYRDSGIAERAIYHLKGTEFKRLLKEGFARIGDKK